MGDPQTIEEATVPADALLVLRLSATATVPRQPRPGDVGYDLHADLGGPGADPVVILAGSAPELVRTGIAVALPPGTYGRVAPRSGLAVQEGIDVVAGVIDTGYRGEVGVALVRHGPGATTIRHGDRIAQLVIERVATPQVVEVDRLTPTDRGAQGFGSTGKGA